MPDSKTLLRSPSIIPLLVFAVIVWSRTAGCPPAAEAAAVDVAPREVARIQPGTVIADRAPKGWSHLIIKSHPRIGPTSVEKVSASTARLAGMLFTAFVADVRANNRPGYRPSYYLAGVGVGLGTKVKGHDMILSSETQEDLGAELGFLQRSVLSSAEAEVRRIHYSARSRTMALLDAPSVLLIQGKHYQVLLRYAILVDPTTGRLDTLLWVLDPRGHGANAVPLSDAQLLAANQIVDCRLHVDPDEFIWGVPTALAFAMERIPQGRREAKFPNAWKPIAAGTRLRADSAAALENQLQSWVSRQVEQR